MEEMPAWLSQREASRRTIIEVVVLEFGAGGSAACCDPCWFQALGCALGFDWHSSGLTTTTCAALKEGIKNREKELGLFIAGGKGKTAIQTPREIEAAGNRFALNRHVEKLQEISRLVAKVDNTALQDGLISIITVFFTDKGDWSVVRLGYEWKHPLGQALSLAGRRNAGFCIGTSPCHML